MNTPQATHTFRTWLVAHPSPDLAKQTASWPDALLDTAIPPEADLAPDSAALGHLYAVPQIDIVRAGRMMFALDAFRASPLKPHIHFYPDEE